MIRIVLAGPVCALALLAGYSAGANASTHAPTATGVLRGVAGRPCEGAPWRGGIPPKVLVTVTLRRGSRALAHRTLTLAGQGGHSFSFAEPAGRYTVSASNGAAPQVVVITAGKTTSIRLEVRGSHAGCA
jgi:hypothetical protein